MSKDFDVLTADADALYERFTDSPRTFGGDMAKLRDEAVRQAEARVRAEYEPLVADLRRDIAKLDAMIDSRPPLSSSPVARAEVTGAYPDNVTDPRVVEVERVYNAHRGGTLPSWIELERDGRKAVWDMFASLSSAPQDAAAVREAERAAADKAMDALFAALGGIRRLPIPASWPGTDAIRDELFPSLPAPPAAPRSVTRCDNCGGDISGLVDVSKGAAHPSLVDCVKALASTLAGTK
jgi:hypothetical protein